MPASDQSSPRTVDAISADTLERLARLDAKGHPLLTLFLNLDPERFPTPDTRATQIGALLDSARRQGAQHEADDVQAWLSANPVIGGRARGVAIFSSTPAGILEAVPLPHPVEPMVVVDSIPWLEPLAAMRSPGEWGVAVMSRREARLFRGGHDSLTEFAMLVDELHRRHAQGGWSQARFQRGIDTQVAVHVRGVIDRLLRAHRARPFRKIAIVCADELRPVIEENLPGELADLVSGTVDADLEHAPAAELINALAPLIEQDDQNREHALIEQLEQALGTGGPAAAGLDEVLSTLSQQRVQTLLVGDDQRLTAWLCPTCGRLSADGDQICPRDGAKREAVDATEHAVEEAARQSTRVVVARYDPAWLSRHGGIAALLRW